MHIGNRVNYNKQFVVAFNTYCSQPTVLSFINPGISSHFHSIFKGYCKFWCKVIQQLKANPTCHRKVILIQTLLKNYFEAEGHLSFAPGF